MARKKPSGRPKVWARIDTEDLDFLDNVVIEKNLKSVSDAVREAIRNYRDDYQRTRNNTKKLYKVSIPIEISKLWEDYIHSTTIQTVEDLLSQTTEKYVFEKSKVVGNTAR